MGRDTDAIIEMFYSHHLYKDLQLNIQTERLADHTARFTVEIDAERLEKAKRTAAKKIAQKVNIPGFRRGKVPYHILVSYIGEAAIMEDALDVLGNEVYKDVLDQSDIRPYGPGAIEDFGIDPQPTFKFVVPLQPTVDLGDYRSIRKDFVPPVIDDSEVDESLETLQERHALIETSHQPVAEGNRVTVDIRGLFLDSDKDDEDEQDAALAPEADVAEDESRADADAITAEAEVSDEADEDEDTEDEAAEEDDRPEEFINQDDVILVLSEDRQPVPGFNAALMGAVVDEEREFELTYPDDEEKYEDMAGRHVKFWVKIKKIETMTLPVLNDEFAARVTENEEKPLSLLELRMRIRDDLQRVADERANSRYASEVLDQILEQATISYPEALIADQVNHMLQHFDNDLRQRGMNLEDYLKMNKRTLDEIRADYREPAINVIRRGLVIDELVEAEKIEVSEERLNEEIERILSQFGDQADMFRSVYQREDMRANLRQDLTNRLLVERIAAIAKGEAVDPQPAANDEPESTSDEAAEQGA
jgi:trigger factor